MDWPSLQDLGLGALGVLSLLWGAGALLLIPLGLPGNWLIAAVGLLGPVLGVGWWPLVVLLALAGLAELLELSSALRTTKRSGAGRAGAWGAVLGGLVGGILATPVLRSPCSRASDVCWMVSLAGYPLATPVLPLVGSLVGACVGAAVGAVLLEAFSRRHGAAALGRIGWGAFLGALLGRLGKALVGVAQLAVWAWWLLDASGKT